MLINFVFLLFICLLWQGSQVRTRKDRGKITPPPLQRCSTLETENSHTMPRYFLPSLKSTNWPNSYTHELFPEFQNRNDTLGHWIRNYTHTHTHTHTQTCLFILFFVKEDRQRTPSSAHTRSQIWLLYSGFPSSGAALPSPGYCIVKTKVGHDHRLAVLSINQLLCREIKLVPHKEADTWAPTRPLCLLLWGWNGNQVPGECILLQPPKCPEQFFFLWS